MKKIVIFDIGNTNIKMNLFNTQTNQALQPEIIIGSSQYLIKKNQSKLINSLKKQLKNLQEPKSKIYIGSASIIFAQSLKNILNNTFNLQNIKIIDHSYDLNVQTLTRKEKVGLDILSCAGYANTFTKNSFVFMFGSASVAIEILNKTITGVSIAPGIGFSFHKLQQHLKKSASGNATWNYPIAFNLQMGLNTLNSVNSGTYRTFLGYIIAHLFLNQNVENKLINNIFITGGDINLIQNLQEQINRLFPHLKIHVCQAMVALGYLNAINKK
ncbi:MULTISPECIES: type III pantothenate kinase [unclassified Mycoplasma]|uniref:type III pantothenate kinase n=1 Tax=unclassified Mycoplasma TaxID=2683645 RepID=UPI00211CCCB2|nr:MULTISPECIES: type III pantothenate kinase [unclassified Mycoplasma]UUM19871.1 type III pantothenate kinase [Mycoplasma sp. 1578d]UUM24855.1 type III pantothenate kinase [Mycoplasma sp. 3686d]